MAQHSKTEIAAAILRPSDKKSAVVHDDHELLLVTRPAPPGSKHAYMLELVTGIRREGEDVYAAAKREVFEQTNLRYTDISKPTIRIRNWTPPKSLDVAVFHLLVVRDDTMNMYDCLPNGDQEPCCIAHAASPAPLLTADRPACLVWRQLHYLNRRIRNRHFGPLLEWYVQNKIAQSILCGGSPGFNDCEYKVTPIRAENSRSAGLMDDAPAVTRNHVLAGPRVFSVDWSAAASATTAAAVEAPKHGPPPIFLVCMTSDNDDTSHRFPDSRQILIKITKNGITTALELVTDSAADAPGAAAESTESAVARIIQNSFGVDCHAPKDSVVEMMANQSANNMYRVSVRLNDAALLLMTTPTSSAGEAYQWWSLTHLIHLFSLRRKFDALVALKLCTRKAMGAMHAGRAYMGLSIDRYIIGAALQDYLRVAIYYRNHQWKPVFIALSMPPDFSLSSFPPLTETSTTTDDKEESNEKVPARRTRGPAHHLPLPPAAAAAAADWRVADDKRPHSIFDSSDALHVPSTCNTAKHCGFGVFFPTGRPVSVVQQEQEPSTWKMLTDLGRNYMSPTLLQALARLPVPPPPPLVPVYGYSNRHYRRAYPPMPMGQQQFGHMFSAAKIVFE